MFRLSPGKVHACSRDLLQFVQIDGQGLGQRALDRRGVAVGPQRCCTHISQPQPQPHLAGGAVDDQVPQGDGLQRLFGRCDGFQGAPGISQGAPEARFCAKGVDQAVADAASRLQI